MKKLFSFAFVLFTFNVSAQGLKNHIPAYAQYVITLNAQSYNSKADMTEVRKMEFFSSLTTGDNKKGTPFNLISSILSKPDNCGVQLLPQAYIFRIEHDTIFAWCYLFSIKEAESFTKFIKTNLKGEDQKEVEIQTSNGYSSTHAGLVHTAWTHDFGLIMIRDASVPYYYNDDYFGNTTTQPYNAAQEDSIQAVEMIKIQAASDSIMKAEEEAAKHVKPVKKEIKKKNKEPEIKKTKNDKPHSAEKVTNEEEVLRVADSIAVAMTAQMQESDFSSGDNEWQKSEKIREEKRQKKMNERCLRGMNNLINLPAGKSVGTIRSFNESQNEKFDIAFWMSYTSDAFSLLNPMGRNAFDPYKHSDTASSLVSLMKNNYSVAYCNFDQGKVNIEHKVFVNPELEKLVNGIYRKSVNKTFAKYIKGANLMGYAAMSVNIEKMLKTTRTIMTQFYDSNTDAVSKYVNGFFDIAAVFTNDDVMYNLFKGDAIIAITDLRPFKTTYLSYTYDDNFNRSESKQEKTEVLPEFVAMATIGKPEEMKKILKAIEKMEGIKQEGAGVYVVNITGSNKLKIYIALENNILFCTNNEELIHEKLKSGYSKKDRMTSEQCKLMDSWPIVYYWNGTKTFELIGKQPEFKAGEKMMKNLNLFKDNIRDAQMTGVTKEGNAYKSSMSISLKDSSVNSLLGIFRMVNSFFLIDK